MELKFSVQYHKTVIDYDISKLSQTWKDKIKVVIENKLTTEPETFGKPLRRSLKGYRKLRVGNYRIIFRLEKKTVKILAIVHRSVVYKEAQGRIKK